MQVTTHNAGSRLVKNTTNADDTEARQLGPYQRERGNVRHPWDYQASYVGTGLHLS